MEIANHLGNMEIISLKDFTTLKRERKWWRLSHEDVMERVKSYDSSTTDTREETAAEQYFKQIVGREFNLNPHNKRDYLINGISQERIVVIFHSKSVLEYCRGLYTPFIQEDSANGTFNLVWEADNPDAQKEYVYELKKGIFGRYYVECSAAKFELVIDDDGYVSDLKVIKAE